MAFVVEDFVADLERIIGYQYINKMNGFNAIFAYGVHITIDGQYVSINKNDRVAVFGDAVADAILCEIWVASNSNKETWTRARGAILGNIALAELGYNLKLDQCIVMSPGAIFVSDKTMATTMEAIFGTVFQDGGRQALECVMNNLGIVGRFRDLMTYTMGTSRSSSSRAL